jgi:hypothetical protein
MRFSLAMLGQHLGSIILALIVWCAGTILVGLALFQIWPPQLVSSVNSESLGATSIMLGVSFGQTWQNVPANILGFISALHAFQALCPKYK